MNLSHAQMASKEATAMQQRMMQFIHRGSNSHDTAAEPATDASAAKAEVAAAEDTQNSPQGKKQYFFPFFKILQDSERFWKILKDS